jgi:predicted nucleic acid-binding Zn ribbon protein
MNDEDTSQPTDRVDAAAEAIARARNHSRSQPAQQNRVPGTRVSTGAGPDLRDPTLVSTAIAHLLRDRGWERQTAVGGLIGRWHEIVGSDIAEHVVPESFQPAPDGNGMVLVLRAESTAWATSHRLLLPQVRARIDAEIGAGTVRDISVLGPAAPSWRHGKFTVQGRGPRDTYG